MDFPGLAERVARVRGAIAEAQARGGWSHPVRIVAVTKTHGPEAVRAAWQAGLTEVGENRVQEALPKMAATTGVPVAWHLVGTLQRNKARQAAGRFALIQSLDRPDLAAELARRVPPGERQPVLVQVNCSAEPQKGGVEPAALPGLLDALRALPALEPREPVARELVVRAWLVQVRPESSRERAGRAAQAGHRRRSADLGPAVWRDG